VIVIGNVDNDEFEDEAGIKLSFYNSIGDVVIESLSK
jgi:hypothetical protein